MRARADETLSADERRLYDDEMARHDRDASVPPADLARLKSLRDQAARLVSDNADLRVRLARLEEEQARVERSLSRETRQRLGVGE